MCRGEESGIPDVDKVVIGRSYENTIVTRIEGYCGYAELMGPGTKVETMYQP